MVSKILNMILLERKVQPAIEYTKVCPHAPAYGRVACILTTPTVFRRKPSHSCCATSWTSRCL